MGADEKTRVSDDTARADLAAPVLPTVNPTIEKTEPPRSNIHPAVYVAVWISLSSSVIMFNKYILDRAGFHFPIVLTTIHLTFATIMTQLMARFTNMLDSRHKVPMTGRIYLRAILPIGFFFSLSLIFGNKTYLYLSVSFIQMLKATMPVATLLCSWALGVTPPSLKTLGNVSLIVVGVMIACWGEINFVVIGVIYQALAVVAEALRLTLIGRLLSSAEFKMDPLVSLYYFAPVCATMNAIIALVVEVPTMGLSDIYDVGILVLFANAAVAFLLNISVVMLIGKTSSLVFTLCGVLKDILLVVASLVIFGDPVSGIQAFGYSIALAGLVYYKFGAEQLREHARNGMSSFYEYNAKHPAMTKFIGFVVFISFVLIIMGGLFPGYIPSAVSKYWIPGSE